VDRVERSGPKRICIIDDDVEYGEFLASFLRAQGLEVSLYQSGSAFIADGDIASHDFFLVDLGLPGIDGVDVIMLIRAQSNAGVIIISGRMGPDAFNAGLSAGADMFLNKPVRFDQVLQAMRTVSHRVSAGDSGVTHWTLDGASAELACSNGRAAKLTPLELQIFQLLAEQGEAGCDRETMAARLGVQDAGSARNLDAAIFRLRKKVEQATHRAAPIRTLHGVGYALGANFHVK
jgi:two-component system OmpR family response regulator